MKRIQRFALAGAAVAMLFAGVASSAAAGSPAKDPQIPDGVVRDTAAACMTPVNLGNADGMTKVMTSVDPRNYFSTAWVDLECGTMDVAVPRGFRAGIVVRTDAEVTCTGSEPNQDQWCQGRVLINNTEAAPVVMEADGSFAWANASTDGGAWESNSFTRSWTSPICPRIETPPGSSTPPPSPCFYKIRVQVRNHAEGLNFRVDDSTVEARLIYV